MKKTLLVLGFCVFLVLVIGLYFFVYRPYEKKVAYDRSVTCSNMVTKYWNAQTPDTNEPGTYYLLPYSHFNTKLNTCLADTKVMSDSRSSSVTTSQIVDVVSGKTLIESDVENHIDYNDESATSTLGGLSEEEYTKQAEKLMSE